MDTKDDLRAADSIAAALRAVVSKPKPVKPKDDPSGAIDLTGQRAGRAFQILAVPGNPKPR